jgi:putative glutathione S-transferase
MSTCTSPGASRRPRSPRTIVSTHTPDILRDLTRQFTGHGPDLHPRGADEAIAAVDRLCEQGITAPAQRAGQSGGAPAARDTALATLLRALDVLEWRLASQEHVLGDEITLADVQLWVTLVQLDTAHRHHLDAAAVHRITDHPRLWAYARRLAAHPAFGSHLDRDGIARRHQAHCRGAEAAGAAVQIVDWAAYARREAQDPVRQPGSGGTTGSGRDTPAPGGSMRLQFRLQPPHASSRQTPTRSRSAFRAAGTGPSAKLAREIGP